MTWFTKGEEDEDDDVPIIIRIDTLSEKAVQAIAERMRAFLLDIKVPNYEEVIQRFGIPTGGETHPVDIEASEERIARLAPLRMLLHNFAHLATASVEINLREHADIDEVDEVMQPLMRLVESAAYTSLLASIAQMEDMGLITYNWEEWEEWE
jgi:hypothetical protein